MAPEAIEDRSFTAKTDVWSFGVLCWELFSFARVPFPDVRTSELLPALHSGKRPAQPARCPPDVYTILTSCWALSAQQRLTIQQVRARLENAHSVNAGISLEAMAEDDETEL